MAREDDPAGGGEPQDDWFNQQVQTAAQGGQQGITDPGTPGGVTPEAPAAAGGGDPLRAQIAQWAAMPGADPSLANDPDYWVNAINSRGGLNAGNTQYWQNASVGPSAFFNNPGREGGQGGNAPAPNVGAAGQAAQSISQMGAYQAPAPYAGNTNYTPTAINAPAAVTAQQVTKPADVTAQQVTPQPVATPGQITAPQQAAPAQINKPADVQAQQITAAQAGAPDQVKGPEALTARLAADPSAFSANLTPEELAADPSYQFRLQQGLGAAQSSAAAKGLLHTGGTLAGLSDYAQQSASQQYQTALSNKLNAYQTNVNNNLATIGQNNSANAQAYGLTNQYQQNAALANQGANLQQGMFNAGQSNAVSGQNAANALQAGTFNAGMDYNTQAQNIANLTNQQQFNAGLNYNAQGQNIANTMQTNQFNAGQNLQGQGMNQGANLQAGQFNAGQNLQAQGMNQGANLQAGQFNAGMNYNTQIANEGNRFQASQANNANNLAAYGLNAQTGLNAYNASSNNALGVGQLGLGYQQAANNYSLGLGNLGLGYANYGLNQQGQNYNQGLSTFNANQGANQQLFNNNYSLAQLGMQGAQGANAAGQAYANNSGSLYGDIGNAQGAGSIAAGNAYSTGLNNMGNLVGQYGLYNQYFGGQRPNTNTQPNGADPWAAAFPSSSSSFVDPNLYTGGGGSIAKLPGANY